MDAAERELGRVGDLDARDLLAHGALHAALGFHELADGFERVARGEGAGGGDDALFGRDFEPVPFLRQRDCGAVADDLHVRLRVLGEKGVDRAFRRRVGRAEFDERAVGDLPDRIIGGKFVRRGDEAGEDAVEMTLFHEDSFYSGFSLPNII